MIFITQNINRELGEFLQASGRAERSELTNRLAV